MKNYLFFPMETLNLSQSYTDNNHLTHNAGTPKDYPIDCIGIDGNQSAVFCPCNEIEIVRIFQPLDGVTENTLYLESTSDCITPSGVGKIFMTISHPNDSSINQLRVGQKFHKGDIITYEGTSGVATGNHIHLTVGFGQCRYMTENSAGSYVFVGDTRKPEDMMYIDPTFTTTRMNTKSLAWKDIPTEPSVSYIGTPVLRDDLIKQLQVSAEVTGYNAMTGNGIGRVNLGTYNVLTQIETSGTIWYKLETNLWVTFGTGVEVLPYYPLGEISFMSLETELKIGNMYQLNLSNPKEGREYTVHYQFGSTTGTIGEKVGNPLYWTLPKEFYDEIPTTTTGLISFTCETYDQGVLRGTTGLQYTVTGNLSDMMPNATLTFTTDELSQQLTKTTDTLIYGKSDLTYEIKGEAKRGATIKEYHLMLDKDTIVSQTGTITQTYFIDKIYYYVSDSRGLGTWQILDINVIPYVRPTIDVSLFRDAQEQDQIVLSYAGTFFNQAFGSKEDSIQNELAISYRFRKQGEIDWSQPQVCTPVVDETDFFQGSLKITGSFDLEENYEFEMKLTDKITSIVITKEVKGGNEMNFDLIYPIGRGFIDYTDTDYTNYLGFTWEKTLLGRVPVGQNQNQPEFANMGQLGGDKRLQQHTHSFSGNTGEAGWHQHWTGSQEMCVKLSGQSSYTSLRPSGYSSISYVPASDGAGTHTHYMSGATTISGEGTSQNLQPYQVVNFWKRIA